ncbi:hypothetical protein, partial [Shewanella vesiculosa]|uniref:hypothetical protein n=1 Tax=Shewanella vesiculosa TaxID=518738 RepID=UPI001A9E24CE
MTNLRYIVRLATLFRALGSSGDTDGSLKSGEQRFIRPHVARPKVCQDRLDPILVILQSGYCNGDD